MKKKLYLIEQLYLEKLIEIWKLWNLCETEINNGHFFNANGVGYSKRKVECCIMEY